MIDVRIRTDLDVTSVPLCSVPFDQVGKVIPALAEWGVFVDGHAYGRESLSGSFNVDEDGAFFEVLIETGSDD